MSTALPTIRFFSNADLAGKFIQEKDLAAGNFDQDYGKLLQRDSKENVKDTPFDGKILQEKTLEDKILQDIIAGMKLLAPGTFRCLAVFSASMTIGEVLDSGIGTTDKLGFRLVRG